MERHHSFTTRSTQQHISARWRHVARTHVAPSPSLRAARLLLFFLCCTPHPPNAQATNTANAQVQQKQWFDETPGTFGAGVRGKRVLIVDEVDDTRATLQ